MDPVPRILVSGVSGPIGAALLPSLQARGYQVTRLVRGAAGHTQIPWDPARPPAPESVSGFDAIIHLAGETVVGRWTAAKKARIRDSRVLGTRNLAQALAQASQRPPVLITASAIGYYGDRGDEILREDSSPGKGFLPEVCREWEAATEAASAAGIRTAQVRIGLVLSPVGGALQKMLTPFKLGLGGNMGNGRQWWSWIDVGDLVGAIHHILENDRLAGPVNAVAPSPVTNAEFTKTLAGVLSRPAILPMPALAARLAFGQMADELLLASQRVEPTKLMASGYPFQHSDLKKALEDLLKR
ncbi:MAG: TIGR01777 family oxidoreductase [Acidobacteriia bacterium]|nr:TIGR01777 family oxidoreductase [Terriglobia bacterium]